MNINEVNAGEKYKKLLEYLKQQAMLPWENKLQTIADLVHDGEMAVKSQANKEQCQCEIYQTCEKCRFDKPPYEG